MWRKNQKPLHKSSAAEAPSVSQVTRTLARKTHSFIPTSLSLPKHIRLSVNISPPGGVTWLPSTHILFTRLWVSFWVPFTLQYCPTSHCTISWVPAGWQLRRFCPPEVVPSLSSVAGFPWSRRAQKWRTKENWLQGKSQSTELKKYKTGLLKMDTLENQETKRMIIKKKKQQQK